MIRRRLIILLAGIALCVTVSRCAQIVINTGMVMVSVPYFLVVGPYAAVDYAKRGRSGEYGYIEASFSEDGQYVGFILRDKSKRGKYQHLYLLSLKTNEIRQLTKSKRYDIDLAFAPDSKSILFSTVRRDSENSQDHAELNMIDISGMNLERIHTGKSIYYNPIFSRDGSKIAVTIENKIQVMNSDGSQSRLLSETDGGDAYPTFTQDGRSIIFWRAGYFGHTSPIAFSTRHDMDLYIASIDSGKSHPLAKTDYYRVESYYASPGANYLIWTNASEGVYYANYSPSGGFDGPHEFAPKGPPFTYQLEGEERQRVFHYPAISPDGSTVLLGISTEPPQPRALEYSSPAELHSVDIVTGKSKQLTRLGGRIIDPKYSPDGSKILFRVDPDPSKIRKVVELWVMNSDGSDLRQIDFDGLLVGSD